MVTKPRRPWYRLSWVTWCVGGVLLASCIWLNCSILFGSYGWGWPLPLSSVDHPFAPIIDSAVAIAVLAGSMIAMEHVTRTYGSPRVTLKTLLTIVSASATFIYLVNVTTGDSDTDLLLMVLGDWIALHVFVTSLFLAWYGFFVIIGWVFRSRK